VTDTRTGWTVVGQTADVLQIAATILGFGAVTLAAIGGNRFSNPDNTTLIIATITFATVGTISIVTALARSRQDNAAFTEGSRATVRTLYTIGALMLILAVGTGLFLVLRPEIPTVTNCQSR